MVTLTILVIFGLMVLVKDNFKALSVLYGLIITGMMVMAFVSFGQERMGLSPVTWLFLQSLCLYMAYLTFQTIFFDRFIACFKIRGNVGFFIVLTDFLGYTGTILVLVLKEFVGTRLDWAVFYNQLAGYVGIFCCATFVASFVYLRQRYRKETALCGCEEIATLEPTENNVLTIAQTRKLLNTIHTEYEEDFRCHYGLGRYGRGLWMLRSTERFSQGILGRERD